MVRINWYKDRVLATVHAYYLKGLTQPGGSALAYDPIPKLLEGRICSRSQDAILPRTNPLLQKLLYRCLYQSSD